MRNFLNSFIVLIFFFMALPTASLLVGCSPDENSANGRTTPAPKDDTNPDFSKALPSNDRDSQVLSLIDEMMKVQRSIPHLMNKPERDFEDGCIKYDRRGRGTFLVAHYHCISRFKTNPRSADDVKIELHGHESFQENREGSQRSTAGRFRLVLSALRRPATPLAIFDIQRSIVLRALQGSWERSLSFEFNSKSLVSRSQKSSKGTATFQPVWNVLGEGSWSAHAQGKAQLNKNSSFSFEWADDGGGAPRDSTVELINLENVLFAGECLRPMGAFEWNHRTQGDPQTGELELTPNGIKDLSNDSIRPWPESCQVQGQGGQ